MSGNPDGTGSHLVPRPPPRGGSGKRRKAKRKGDARFWLWPVAFGAGIGIGVLAYQFIPSVDFYFDYWVALALS